jgi:hypothetical protein
MIDVGHDAGRLNGDMAGCETWHRILNAIERLQATVPAGGETIQ